MRVSGGLAGLAASVLVVGLAAIPVARAADAAASPSTAANLYVDFNGPCSNSGPGTLAEPFCSVQAAANMVDPGQTVDVLAASATEAPQSVTITRSGTAAEPITFTWPGTGDDPLISPQKETGKPVVTLDGVHDVTLSHLQIQDWGTDDGIDVIGSSGISLADLSIDHIVMFPDPMPSSGISIDGASSDVTVSRTLFEGTGKLDAVLSNEGARQVTLTTNMVKVGTGAGFTLDGTTKAVVTGNTVLTECDEGTLPSNDVTFANGSSGTVENNVFENGADGACVTPPTALSVDASSASGVTADYNAFFTQETVSDYTWAGTRYADPADFTVATGQGVHDITLPGVINGAPAEGSPAIDSANCSAPGELSADILGNPWVLDPLATDADLGSGTCRASRGAYARQDSLPVTYTVPPLDQAGYPAGTVPFTFRLIVTGAATSPWDEPVSYTANFGDGSAPVRATRGIAMTHVYKTPGAYTITISAADLSGSRASATYHVYALPVHPLAIKLSAVPVRAGGYIQQNEAGFTSSPGNLGTDTADDRGGEVAELDFSCGGGGTTESATASTDSTWQCRYVRPGTNTATLSVMDMLGRWSIAQATISVGDEPLHVFPSNDYNREVAAHAVVKIPLSTLATADPGDASGALVDITVTGAGKAGYVAMYPNGSTWDGMPTVQFQAGESAENSALAIGGIVDFYNGSAAPIHLGVTSYGIDTTGPSGPLGETYSPVTPASVLPRTKIAGGHQVTLRAADRDHVPAAAQDVVLDITASGGTAAGHFATSAAGDEPARGGNATAVAGGYWARGHQVTNLIMVPVEGTPAVLKNVGPGSAYFTASVVGYYAYSGSAAVFLPRTPQPLGTVTIGARRSVTMAAAGRIGIPAADTTAVAVNLTASRATAAGTITAYANGTSLPGLISLSYARGATIANAAIVAVGAGGAIRLYNRGSKPVTVSVDLDGSYYAYP